jgi:hypothetical protein
VTRWRVGQKLGRTLYVQRGAEPSADDEFIGIMDTRELAALVVEAVRRVHADWRAPVVGETWEPRGDHPDHDDPLRILDPQGDHYLCAVEDGGSSTRRVSVLDLNLYYSPREGSPA